MTLSAQRKGRVTGSQAGAILGLCPWRTREDVIRDWLYGSTFEGNAATEYGKFHEEHAFADLQLMYPNARLSNDEFVIADQDHWLGCTPDGYIDSENAVIEIKCPFNLKDDENPQFKAIEDQPHYYAQVQIEMYCTGRDVCHFYQWNRFDSQLSIVNIDHPWLDDNLPKLAAFIIEVEQRRETMSDDEKLAIEYLELKKASDEANDALKNVKEALIKRANGVKRKFGNVSVYTVERKGSISYSKIVKEHLPDLDTSPYMGKPSTSWVVK
jgi:putative phage-type endonuclease